MYLERMCRGSRRLKRALALPGNFTSLILAALLLSPGASFAVTGDFNGDLRGDILWRNSTTGQVYVWLTDVTGTAKQSAGSPGTLGSDWAIQGVGDFNGDTRADVLWRNSTSGKVFIWLTNASGTGIQAAGSPGTLGFDWSIQGVGDFNGDGRADVLWRNGSSGKVYIWLTNAAGTGIQTAGSPGTLGSDWSIQGIGDFNGDTRADVLWRNTTSGKVYIWLTNAAGTGILTAGSPGTISTDWSIQGAGDFNGDLRADILWRNSTTGQIYLWFTDGTGIGKLSAASISTVSSDWSIQGVNDFNGDSRADIIWRNSTSGKVYIWLTNSAGTGISSTGSPGTLASDWQIAPTSAYHCPDGVVCDIVTATNGIRANGPFGPGNPAPSPALSPLAWSVGAATVARDYAAQCNWGHNPNRGPYGENIYASSGFTLTALGIVNNSWAAEAANYNYSTNTCGAGSCGHYTQIVWRNTTAVGCAVQHCTANSPFGTFNGGQWDYAVCDYAPPGNFNGELPY